MLEKRTGYQLCCDNCHSMLEIDGLMDLFSNPALAEDVANENGWIEQDGKIYCDKCKGDYDHETDRYKIKIERNYDM